MVAMVVTWNERVPGGPCENEQKSIFNNKTINGLAMTPTTHFTLKQVDAYDFRRQYGSVRFRSTTVIRSRVAPQIFILIMFSHIF